jgi:hypothetical protein
MSDAVLGDISADSAPACKFVDELPPWNHFAAFNVQRTGGALMVKQTVAGLVAAIFALGMTTAVYAQTPKPAETMEKKADKAPAEKKRKAVKKADKAAADKKMEQPADAKK